MHDADGGPGDERRRARDGDEVGEDLAGLGADVHQRDQAEQVGEDDGADGHAGRGGGGEEARRAAQAGEREQRARADVDGGVDGGQVGGEDDDVDERAGRGPAAADERDGPGREARLGGCGEEGGRVGGHDDGGEEDHADEDDEDAREGLLDGGGQVALGGFGLAGRDGDHFRAAVVDGGEDEGLREAADAVDEGPGGAPVPEADVVASDGAGVDEDGDQEAAEDAEHFPRCEPELHLAVRGHGEQGGALEEGPGQQDPSVAWHLVCPEAEDDA